MLHRSSTRRAAAACALAALVAVTGASAQSVSTGDVEEVRQRLRAWRDDPKATPPRTDYTKFPREVKGIDEVIEKKSPKVEPRAPASTLAEAFRRDAAADANHEANRTQLVAFMTNFARSLDGKLAARRFDQLTTTFKSTLTTAVGGEETGLPETRRVLVELFAAAAPATATTDAAVLTAARAKVNDLIAQVNALTP